MAYWQDERRTGKMRGLLFHAQVTDMAYIVSNWWRCSQEAGYMYVLYWQATWHVLAGCVACWWPVWPTEYGMALVMVGRVSLLLRVRGVVH